MATIYSNNETINIDPTDDLVLYKEEFINSRIEKFLYAICALDFDDLPTPLSRIEELYKCLATGLPAPTFVPQSRVEKYLMAILGDYDASALPAPQSRTEVLLKKILMGDTDLSDIEWLKSRYEFLLAYIAKGGEISSGSGNDFEYLQYIFSSSTYSIDRTKELPVKSAILKGRTMVNLFAKTGVTTSNPPYLSIKGNMTQIKASTIYTIKYFNLPTEKTKQLRVIERHSSDTVHVIPVSGIGTFTTNSDISNFKSLTVQVIETTSGSISEEELSEVKILLMEGDYTNVDIPYFEGIGSVKMPVLTTTGKNLFNSALELGKIGIYGGNENATDRVRTVEYTKLSPNTTYSINSGISKINRLALYDDSKTFVRIISTVSNGYSFTTNNNEVYCRFDIQASALNDEKIQIEEGSVATEYELYKSTTVTCNEEVELRGIGDVKDELDLLTGELTQRVAKIVLDGSEESIFLDTTKEITRVFKIVIDNSLFLIGYDTIFISDSLPNGGSGDVEKFVANIFSSSSTIYVALNKTKASTIPEFREYLSKNPLTILGPAKNQTIETVNPATKDQDGNEAKLSSFEDITHVTVTSEGILPDVELSVAKYYPYLTFLLESVSMDTLYNTKELPVKSAILKGNTLVNLTCHDRRISNVSDVNLTEGRLTWTTNADWQRVYFVVNGKPNTKYIIKYQSIHENVEIYYRLDTTNINQSGAERIYNSNQTITSGNTGTFIISLERATASSDSWVQDFMIIEYQDGMENWDIPYFEGIGSVKMPVLTTSNEDDTKSTTVTCNEEVELRGIGDVKDELDLLTGELTRRIGKIVLDGSEDEEWGISTNSNDTIACFHWSKMALFRAYGIDRNKSSKVISDRFPYSDVAGTTTSITSEGVNHIYDSLRICIEVSKLEDVSVASLRNWLSANPTIVHYRLPEEFTVESATLNITDQDGNEAKLSSFEDITHVTVTSEGILPDVELSIANQFEEDLTTLSLRMNNIATTQEELGESVNEQTTEVDSTMMATTEIYEGLL